MEITRKTHEDFLNSLPEDLAFARKYMGGNLDDEETRESVGHLRMFIEDGVAVGMFEALAGDESIEDLRTKFQPLYIRYITHFRSGFYKC